MGNRTSRSRRDDIELSSPSVARGDIESGPETNYDVLSERLEILYKKELLFKRRAQEVSDITGAVKELVGRILDEVGIIDPRFTCSPKYRHFVGSMAEGTRIIEPDEFDFLVVIDDLSFSDAVTWSRPEHDSSGCVHIKIDNSIKEQWNEISKQGVLKSTATHIIDKGVKETFLKTVRKAVANVIRRGDDAIPKATGNLKLSSSNVQQNGVACTCSDSFLWSSTATTSTCATELSISVDITAAIQTTFAKSGIQSSDVADDELYNQMKDNDTVLAVPCGRLECPYGKCFKYSVTTLELEKMNIYMRDHFKCYMILKHLLCCACKCKLPCLHLPNGLLSHSYAIKNVLFNHVVTCMNGGLGLCVNHMIELMKEYCHTRCEAPRLRRMPVNDGSLRSISPYNVKVSKASNKFFFEMIISTDTFDHAAIDRIKQTLNIASNTNMPTECRAGSSSSLPRFATFKKYHFPLVFFVYILQWMCLYSSTCVPGLMMISLKTTLSAWWVLVVLVALVLLQTLIVRVLYSISKVGSNVLRCSLFFLVEVLCLLLIVVSAFRLLPRWLTAALLMLPTFIVGTMIFAWLLWWSRHLLLRCRRRLSMRTWLLLQVLAMTLLSIVLSLLVSLPFLLIL